MSWEIQLALVTAMLLFVVFGNLVLLKRFYRHAMQGTAWVRSGIGGTQVAFGGIFCVPLVHRLEAVDVTAKKLELRHFGEAATHTQDKIPVDVQVGIILRIPPNEQSVIEAVRNHGAENLANPQWLNQLFGDRFEEALIGSLKQFTWEEIDRSYEPLRAEFQRRIGTNLLSFTIEDISFGHLAKQEHAKITSEKPEMRGISKN